jgi:hypothetical protein
MISLSPATTKPLASERWRKMAGNKATSGDGCSNLGNAPLQVYCHQQHSTVFAGIA